MTEHLSDMGARERKEPVVAAPSDTSPVPVPRRVSSQFPAAASASGQHHSNGVGLQVSLGRETLAVLQTCLGSF